MKHDLLLNQLAFGGQSESKIAVIDIGSNSVRLVIYDSMKRVPLPIYNEKVFCGLGRGLSRTNRLHSEGVKLARQAISRLLASARVNHAAELHIIATAAVRDADDGKAFIKELERTHKVRIKIISGKKEATYAAMGVVSSHLSPSGLVADLGGGSMELIALEKGVVKEQDSQPIGVLQMLDRAGKKPALMVDLVRRYLGEAKWLKEGEFDALYAVGGSFRALAKLHMQEQNYPLDLLHGYEVPATDIQPLLDEVGAYNEATATALPVSQKRQLQMPVAARILSCLIDQVKPQKLVFSASGIREGLLFSQLSPYVRQEDPLIASCDMLQQSFKGKSRYVRELFQWMTPLLQGESEGLARLRLAACMLNHLALYVQRPNRATWAYHHILQSTIHGLTHPERVTLAAALYYRYQPRMKYDWESYKLIDEQQRSWAALVGATMRLGYLLSGGAPGNLPQTQLRLDYEKPKLRLPNPMKALKGESLDRRLEAVQQAFAQWHKTVI